MEEIDFTQFWKTPRHGKESVDTISGVGFKCILKSEVLAENVSVTSAADCCNYRQYNYLEFDKDQFDKNFADKQNKRETAPDYLPNILEAIENIRNSYSLVLPTKFESCWNKLKRPLKEITIFLLMLIAIIVILWKTIILDDFKAKKMQAPFHNKVQKKMRKKITDHTQALLKCRILRTSLV